MRKLFVLVLPLLMLVAIMAGCGAGAGPRPEEHVSGLETPPDRVLATAPSPTVLATVAPVRPTPTPSPTPTPLDPTSPDFVDLYLAAHPKIASAIVWEPSHDVFVVWAQWTSQQKQDLRLAFSAAWQWHEGGMQTYTGFQYADPPVNQQYVDASSPWSRTVLDPTTAWNLYLAFVAHSLAADAGHWVPVSLEDYDDANLKRLFHSLRFGRPDSNDGGYYDCDLPGGYVLSMQMTPAHPTYVFKWMHDNGLIGATPKDTIARNLDWCRWNMYHFLGGSTFDNRMHYWPYAGLIPVRMVIDGTHMTDPEHESSFPGTHHWTLGCGGTSDFLMNVLRVANIPCDVTTSGDYHLVPHFTAQGLYLSHGDDPYCTSSKANPAFPAEMMLIDEPTFIAWFKGDPVAAAANVGRRPLELCLDYPPDELLAAYCYDVANGLDHASGKVYEYFEVGSSYGPLHPFTVAQLESMGLWTKLSQKAAAKGLCQ